MFHAIISLFLLVCVTQSVWGVDYLLDGDIVLTGDAQCLGPYGIITINARTAPSCVPLLLLEGSQEGTFMIFRSDVSKNLTLEDGSYYSFDTTGTEVRFSSGTEGLTEVDDIISSSYPVLILLASEDPTDPQKCLTQSNNYTFCNVTSDTFYFDPSDCVDINCDRCIPDVRECDICDEGYVVQNVTCDACDTVYGSDCLSCDDSECLSCDGGQVLKADATSQSACTDPCDVSVDNCDHCDVSNTTCSECSDGFELDEDDECSETTSDGNKNHVSVASFWLLLAVMVMERY